MPQVIFTEGAISGLQRGRTFLDALNPLAAQRAGQAIERQLLLPESNPELGRPLADMPELRELIVQFGDAGYAGLYRHEPIEDTVYVLAFRHQREAGY
jgi:plasmid stabilization system protein ParE